MKIIDGKKFLTVTEYTRARNIPEPTVRTQIQKRKLASMRKIDGRWYIAEDDTATDNRIKTGLQIGARKKRAAKALKRAKE